MAARYQWGSSGCTRIITSSAARALAVRKPNTRRNPGVIASCWRRDSRHRSGGSHSAAPPMPAAPRATSTPPPARCWWRTIVANNRVSLAVRALSFDSNQLMTGSS
ncbi:Uncharacterised protein [Mycobacterium tuberculosis]|uniref:Uncharacterized protein n=1 Tax=Mycobacterium tuberculosis TaxID=1773 RepID=A0A654TIU8_MYCTX|nr:Uncharacterised protein [Mycobacterium tuberculosis]CNL28959.1 Uncharacterised protein [Mycobacterium tuberculosis]CNL35188.1 Uncharacterised protein [Mycobacterium tuberculosis]CNL45017.1 Uncharacterised protein [Mycobacterium tuberculosis]CNL73320.1 Uncharacterised protein [Mycobacterium tuberculosis]